MRAEDIMNKAQRSMMGPNALKGNDRIGLMKLKTWFLRRFNKVYIINPIFEPFLHTPQYKNAVSITPFVSQDLNTTGKTDFV